MTRARTVKERAEPPISGLEKNQFVNAGTLVAEHPTCEMLYNASWRADNYDYLDDSK